MKFPLIVRRSIALALLFSFIPLLFLAGCARTEEAEEGGQVIQVKGSDTMVNLSTHWAEVFMEEHPGAQISVTGGGSGTGITALLNGTADLVNASREMTEQEKEKAREKGIEPLHIIVGYDGLAVAVHPDNPVSDLTLQQLSDIFSGEVSNWKEVGGPDMEIVVLSRETNSGTYVYFKEHVIQVGGKYQDREHSPRALLLPSSQAIVDEIEQNRAAVGYFGMGYLTESVKPLAVRKDETSPPVRPDVESVKSGEYPISRPLFVISPGEPQGTVKEFVDFILSQEGQEIILEEDFVPVK